MFLMRSRKWFNGTVPNFPISSTSTKYFCRSILSNPCMSSSVRSRRIPPWSSGWAENQGIYGLGTRHWWSEIPFFSKRPGSSGKNVKHWLQGGQGAKLRWNVWLMLAFGFCFCFCLVSQCFHLNETIHPQLQESSLCRLATRILSMTCQLQEQKL